MIELHIRIIDDQMAVAAHLQTEIHIIKRNCKLFRKASCLQKKGDPNYNKNLSLTKWNYSLKPLPGMGKKKG